VKVIIYYLRSHATGGGSYPYPPAYASTSCGTRSPAQHSCPSRPAQTYVTDHNLSFPLPRHACPPRGPSATRSTSTAPSLHFVPRHDDPHSWQHLLHPLLCLQAPTSTKSMSDVLVVAATYRSSRFILTGSTPHFYCRRTLCLSVPNFATSPDIPPPLPAWRIASARHRRASRPPFVRKTENYALVGVPLCLGLLMIMINSPPHNKPALSHLTGASVLLFLSPPRSERG